MAVGRWSTGNAVTVSFTGLPHRLGVSGAAFKRFKNPGFIRIRHPIIRPRLLTGASECPAVGRMRGVH
jgi:hypothetical protein